MADVQKENGYTSIANELLEKIYKSSFSLRELRIILTVIRFTYGFNRKEAELSLTFLANATNIPLRHVQTTVKNLITKNVLIIKNECIGIHSRKIQLNKNYDSWSLVLTDSVNSKSSLVLTNPVNSSDTDSVNSSIDQSGQPRKKDINKTLKKRIGNFSLPNQLKEINGFSEIWNDWIQLRKEIKKPLTPTTIKRQFSQLIKFKEKGYDVLGIIDTSIQRRWQGFFEPKENSFSFRNNGHKEAILDDF